LHWPGDTQEVDVAKMGRREALGAMSAAGAAIALGCSGDPITSPSSTSAAVATATGTSASCAATPSETIGPFPSLVDLVRGDVREGKAGTTLRLKISVVNANHACAPVANAGVEIWQCDAAGNYSQYGTQARETYLRGIQTTDASGDVSFTTIYPGWYQGRATHIHVEVTMGGRSVKATQMAFDEAVSRAVYATGVYASRGANPTSNLADGIFSDSLSAELVTPTGDVVGGYSATFRVAVAI
jgi:protocatechuate 3,4-dioxygenase beta subunit